MVMQAVDSTVMTTTVSSVCFCISSLRGNIDASAIATEAPQMATAPAVTTPMAVDPSRRRPSRMPKTSVAPSEQTTSSAVLQPVACTCARVMRAPSSATPRRNTVRAESDCVRKFRLMPNSSAYRNCGPP